MASHEGRVAIVTGAARGIGRAISTTLAERGARMVLVDREEASGTAALIEDECLSIKADVTSDEDWKNVVDQVTEKFGRIDILVNNAGIMPYLDIEDTDYEVWRSTLAVNLDAHFLAAKHIVPIMRQQEYGRIISISSNSLGSPLPGFTAYMASKMGVVGFIRGLSNDLGSAGHNRNAVITAFTNTPATADSPDAMRAIVLNAQAIKRIAQPDDIAGPVAFLASDDARFVTGQVLVADGGMYKIS